MAWQNELKALAESRQWDRICSYALHSIQETDPNVDIVIEAIFLLFSGLVYGNYGSEKEYRSKSRSLHELFSIANDKFKDNAKYLFFVGFFITLSEWAFGQDDFSLGYQMLNKAVERQPDNLLYQWGFNFFTSSPAATQLTEELIQDENTKGFLLTSGKAGQFIWEQIENAYQSIHRLTF
jgi:hypothetical protein